MTERLTRWETTRLSKHFILLDFLSDHKVYRSERPLPFAQIWSPEHDALARGLCNDLLEPLMSDERFGPVSIADAFWPSVFKSGHYETKSSPGKHRWTKAGAAVDIALYRLVDKGKRESELRKEVLSVRAIAGCRERVLSYPETEFVCVTYKPEGPMDNKGQHGAGKSRALRAHHVAGRVLLQPARPLPQWPGGRRRRRPGAEEHRDQRPLPTCSRGDRCPLVRRGAGPACGARWSDFSRTGHGNSGILR